MQDNVAKIEPIKVQEFNVKQSKYDLVTNQINHMCSKWWW